MLLLKPLVNWRHCLSTLARARRYAEELGFAVSAAEEAAVWEVFDAQDAELQRGMIERYRLATMPGWGVLEEAELREGRRGGPGCYPDWHEADRPPLCPRRPLEAAPLFHSEAGFQHELAWELRARGLGRGVRLERPFDLPERRNVDLVVLGDEGLVALELKYWPRAWSGEIADEKFRLKNRGAQDLGRYDYWKDVSRIEQLKAAGLIRWGAAVALTNDSAYWPVVRPGTMAEPFRLEDGVRVEGMLAWPRQ